MGEGLRTLEVMPAARWHAEHNVKPGDQVVVLTDAKVEQAIPRAFALAAAARGAEVMVAYVRPPAAPGDHPPQAIVEFFRAADAAITCCSETMSWSEAMMAIIAAGGRHLSVPGANVETFTRGIVEVYFDEDEFRRMRELTRKFARALDEADEVRLTTGRGTDLRGSIRGRVALPSYGVAEETYNHTSFPTGEAMLAPVEGTAHGRAVIDLSMGGVGPLDEPIELTIREGRVVGVEGGEAAKRLKGLLARSGPGADNLAEFGFGTNPRGSFTGNKNADKKILGSAHIALGTNWNFGGRSVPGLGGEVRAAIHLDSVMDRATVYLDGKMVVEEGKVLL
ncbi:MAG: aminopeptidase [Nitrospinota bacterium]